MVLKNEIDWVEWQAAFADHFLAAVNGKAPITFGNYIWWLKDACHQGYTAGLAYKQWLEGIKHE